MNSAIRHHYRRFRAHQNKVATDGGGCLTTYPGGRTERSYASAPYGEHALSAYAGAKSYIAFLKRMKEYVR